MKKLLKAGIVGAIACSMIGGTVTPVAANEISASQNNEVTMENCWSTERRYNR